MVSSSFFQFPVNSSITTMPIDKFGRHMLRATAYPTLRLSTDSTPFYMCEPSKFYSPCVITIRGVSNLRESVAFYALENNEVEYILPVSGVLKDINISPNVQIFINSERFDKANIVNEKLRKGDRLKFSLQSEPTFHTELVLFCPLQKDE